MFFNPSSKLIVPSTLTLWNCKICVSFSGVKCALPAEWIIKSKWLVKVGISISRLQLKSELDLERLKIWLCFDNINPFYA